MGYSPWGRQESDRTERIHFHFSLSCTGEGNGNLLQCSCLENPRDRGASWAAVYWSHRVRHDWSDLAAAAAAFLNWLCKNKIRYGLLLFCCTIHASELPHQMEVVVRLLISSVFENHYWVSYFCVLDWVLLLMNAGLYMISQHSLMSTGVNDRDYSDSSFLAKIVSLKKWILK